jgi:hypothetical protein
MLSSILIKSIKLILLWKQNDIVQSKFLKEIKEQTDDELSVYVK